MPKGLPAASKRSAKAAKAAKGAASAPVQEASPTAAGKPPARMPRNGHITPAKRLPVGACVSYHGVTFWACHGCGNYGAGTAPVHMPGDGHAYCANHCPTCREWNQKVGPKGAAFAPAPKEPK